MVAHSTFWPVSYTWRSGKGPTARIDYVCVDDVIAGATGASTDLLSGNEGGAAVLVVPPSHALGSLMILAS